MHALPLVRVGHSWRAWGRALSSQVPRLADRSHRVGRLAFILPSVAAGPCLPMASASASGALRAHRPRPAVAAPSACGVPISGIVRGQSAVSVTGGQGIQGWDQWTSLWWVDARPLSLTTIVAIAAALASRTSQEHAYGALSDRTQVDRGGGRMWRHVRGSWLIGLFVIVPGLAWSTTFCTNKDTGSLRSPERDCSACTGP
jgi:hypothetical protein